MDNVNLFNGTKKNRPLLLSVVSVVSAFCHCWICRIHAQKSDSKEFDLFITQSAIDVVDLAARQKYIVGVEAFRGNCNWCSAVVPGGGQVSGESGGEGFSIIDGHCHSWTRLRLFCGWSLEQLQLPSGSQVYMAIEDQCLVYSIVRKNKNKSKKRTEFCRRSGQVKGTGLWYQLSQLSVVITVQRPVMSQLQVKRKPSVLHTVNLGHVHQSPCSPIMHFQLGLKW